MENKGIKNVYSQRRCAWERRYRSRYRGCNASNCKSSRSTSSASCLSKFYQRLSVCWTSFSQPRRAPSTHTAARQIPPPELRPTTKPPGTLTRRPSTIISRRFSSSSACLHPSCLGTCLSFSVNYYIYIFFSECRSKCEKVRNCTFRMTAFKLVHK